MNNTITLDLIPLRKTCDAEITSWSEYSYYVVDRLTGNSVDFYSIENADFNEFQDDLNGQLKLVVKEQNRKDKNNKYVVGKILEEEQIFDDDDDDDGKLHHYSQ